MKQKQAQGVMAESKKARVIVGLSGGVDSSVAAAVLLDQGHEVTGVFLECWNEPGCRVDQDRKDALAVALKLGIPFVVLNFRKEYKERVVEYFYREYEVGRTPNPDTMCNREIKFGLFYEWAMKEGCDFVATGHYARVEEGKLRRATDVGKDQSYFLYQIRQEQLEHLLFPIGGMLKREVRKEAKRRGLVTAEKPDSQGICFIGEVDVRKLLKERIKEKPGVVVMRLSDKAKRKLEANNFEFKTTKKRLKIVGDCVVVGKHEGVAFYTIGQRAGNLIDKKILKRMFVEGWFASDPVEMPAMFVVEKDVEDNRMVVGFEEETYKSQFMVGNINWLITKHQAPSTRNVWVRIRNLGELVRARIGKEDSSPSVQNDRVIVSLSKPMRGVAEGQACVFYSDDSVDAVVLGGGTIQG